MNIRNGVGDYLEFLEKYSDIRDEIEYHEVLPPLEPVYGDVSFSWSREIQGILNSIGIKRLYSHQARAIDLIRAGRHVVVATPTASGKSLVYNLPVIDRVIEEPESRALYIFPLKALAQDQMRHLGELSACLEREAAPTFAIYDGDTSSWNRKKIRDLPPNVLLTNPEMLHLSLLAHHQSWSRFWRNLSHVVIDEVHTYRGVMGSHMAWVFRRLNRICDYYGADPTFIFCSATVGNPGELASELTGLRVVPVTESGSARGRRHVLFVNPHGTAAQAAIRLLQEALKRNLRTIVYTQSRKLTELIGIWIRQRAGKLSDKVSSYRAGFLADERREVERKLASGELLAVVSTSALELGIDIGSLDLCILVGYPGTVMATWQRGGRVGRSNQDSALVLVAQEDALDQYFMRKSRGLIPRPP